MNRGLAKRKTATPENIGIDETSYQKRHEYVTVVLDKDNNTVLDVLQDRKAETLDTWFKIQEMADFSALQSISMDMWDAFIKAVKANFDDAEGLIAFDRYHVAQHLNKAVIVMNLARFTRDRARSLFLRVPLWSVQGCLRRYPKS